MDWKFILRIAFSGLLLAVLLSSFDRQDLTALLQIDITWLLAAFACIILAILVSVIKWNYILHGLGFSLNWKHLWNAYWVGMFFNNFFPSSFGGDAARILFTGRETENYPAISVSVVVERIIATIALAVVGLAAALWINLDSLHTLWLFILLLVVSLLALVVMLWGRYPGFLQKRNNSLTKFLRELILFGKKLQTAKINLWWAFLWSLIFQVINVAINYAIMRGLTTVEVSFFILLAVIPATAALAMIPLAVNGYGIREGAYVLLLVPFGVSRSVALSTSLLYALSISFLSLWGGLVWAFHHNKEVTYVPSRRSKTGCGTDESRI